MRSIIMQVHDLMTQAIECIAPDATLQQAAAKMRDLDVGSLPVCQGDRLIGILTDRDIAVRAVANGQNPNTTRVRDAMTPEIIWCFDDQDLNEATQLMKENQIRRLPVLNRNKRLAGIMSLGDLATEAHDEELAAATLEAISVPAGRE
jgi:CBS domain-containing protein